MVEGLFDAHCHLFLMDGEPGQAVEAARASGVEGLVCAGIDPQSSRRSRDLADSLAGVFATAGVHPHTASEWDAEAGAAIEELAGDARVVAVGETGLDYYRLLSPAEDQQRVFRAHCGLARESGKAVVVHTREAWPDVLRILGEERVERVVLHCFTGGVAEAREAASRGYFCSFAGNGPSPTARPSGRPPVRSPVTSCWWRPTAPSWRPSRCGAGTTPRPTWGSWWTPWRPPGASGRNGSAGPPWPTLAGPSPCPGSPSLRGAEPTFGP